MFDHFSLADVKAAPLSIMVYLSMNGNRAVSVTDLAAETGFTEKPIRKGLATLQELGVVVSPRKNRYQLTGREYQLPLSWGEQVLPSGDSPVITGYIPVNTGNSPELERRVSLLEKAVFGYENKGTRIEDRAGVSPDVAGDFPLWDSEMDDEEMVEVLPRVEYSGNIPGKLGVYPYKKEQRQVVSGQWSGNTPEKQGDFPERVEIKSSTHFEKESEAGEIPEEAGIIPENTGEIPEMLINNINTPEEEVSKQVSRSTYLPEKNNTEVNLTTGPGEIPDRTGEVIRWNAALQQMEMLMGKQTFTTILKDAVLLGYEDGHYTVGVKNQMVKDWADQRCRETIEGMLSRMGYGQQTVSFVVSGVVSSETVKPAPKSVSFAQLDSVQELRPATLDLLQGDGELVEICNDYLLDPVGNEYSKEQLQELINMHPDPEVLQWVLQRIAKFNIAKKWCSLDIQNAKRKLLQNIYHIIDPALSELSNNNFVTLDMISEECEKYCPKDKELAVFHLRELGKE